MPWRAAPERMGAKMLNILRFIGLLTGFEPILFR